MHFEKFKGAAVGGILLHADRGLDGTDRKHSNPDIDSTRTVLNYDLFDRDGKSAVRYHKSIIEELDKATKKRTGKGLRKDAVTLCSWVVTLPTDFPKDNSESFFRAAYDFFAQRYGEENIVTAAVHMDEKTPHMHFQFVPIIEIEEEGKDPYRKLCAKEIESRGTLKAIHGIMQKYMTEALEQPVNLLNGATENGNQTVAQMKQAELQKQIDSLQSTVTNLQADIDNLTVQKSLMEQERNDIAALKQEHKALADELDIIKSIGNIEESGNDAHQRNMMKLRLAQAAQWGITVAQLLRDRKEARELGISL